MKTEIFLSSLAGILFSQTLAAPLAPAQLAGEAQEQDLSSSNDATPVAKALGTTPFAAAAAKRATDGDAVYNLPFYTSSTGSMARNTVYRREDALTPLAVASAPAPAELDASYIFKRDDGRLPTRIASEEAGDLAINYISKRGGEGDALSPPTFAHASARSADGSGGGPTAKNMIKRDGRQAVNPRGDDMGSAGIYAVYGAEADDESHDVASPVKRGAAAAGVTTAHDPVSPFPVFAT
ncbi:hypothetical protein CLAIMM_10174 [Cladophialophora immunda]|nr:hypothetical protein CLAIMM_10174 [Cladophialophora immunda]